MPERVLLIVWFPAIREIGGGCKVENRVQYVWNACYLVYILNEAVVTLSCSHTTLAYSGYFDVVSLSLSLYLSIFTPPSLELEH